jgi:hypothetical protein
MMDAILTAISLAGFLFAQVTTVAAGLPHSAFTPVAFVIRGQSQQFQFFKGDTLEAMVADGRRELRNQKFDAWAFAYEGFIVTDGQRKSAVFIEAWARGASGPVVIVQPWEHAAEGNGFTLAGSPLMLPDKQFPEPERTQATSPVALDERQTRAFQAGISRQKELSAKGLLGSPVPGPSPH